MSCNSGVDSNFNVFFRCYTFSVKVYLHSPFPVFTVSTFLFNCSLFDQQPNSQYPQSKCHVPHSDIHKQILLHDS